MTPPKPNPISIRLDDDTTRKLDAIVDQLRTDPVTGSAANRTLVIRWAIQELAEKCEIGDAT